MDNKKPLVLGDTGTEQMQPGDQIAEEFVEAPIIRIERILGKIILKYAEINPDILADEELLSYAQKAQ